MKKIKINITSIDRMHRIVFSSTLLVLALIRVDINRVHISEYIAIVMQLELLFTGIFGWCPLTWLFKRKIKS